jgi:D-alanyl-D-alanine carboxypeptidase
MNARRILILIALLAAHAAGAPAQDAGVKAAQDDERLARILSAVRSRLEESRAEWKFPGATAAFVLPGGRSASVSTGLADIETKTALKPSDMMPAGSVGKTFVAAVALRLVEGGRLKLDDRLEQLLGSERWFARLPNSKDLTLRILLNHSSGIPNHVEDAAFLKALFNNSARDMRHEELLAYVLDKKPLFPAGRGYHYADTNYILAGLAVERAAGRTLYEEAAELILKPLGLAQTVPSDSATLGGVANGYLKNRPVVVAGRFTVNPQWEWAGGGFASTAEDLARWAQALYGGSVLRTATLEEMFRSTTEGEGAGYGLGVETKESRWGKSYGHDGEFPGYLSDVRYYPRYRVAVAVQVNADETNGAERFIATAVEDVTRAVVRELNGRTLPEADASRLTRMTEDWLRLVDARRFAESRDALSPELKAKFGDAEKWRAALAPFLARVGAMKRRRLKSVDYVSPEADAVALDFESSFAKLPAAAETVVLKAEAGGAWRVASYSIH